MLAERWNSDMFLSQPQHQIRPKFPESGSIFKVAIGCRDNAAINRAHQIFSQALIRFLVESCEECGLCFHRNFTYLVEQQSAFGCLLEQIFSRLLNSISRYKM